MCLFFNGKPVVNLPFCFSTHRFYKKEVLGCEGDSVLSAPGVMMQTYLCERTKRGTMEIWMGDVHLLCFHSNFSLLFLGVNKLVYWQLCLYVSTGCFFSFFVFFLGSNWFLGFFFLFVFFLFTESKDRHVLCYGQHHIRPTLHSGSSIK